MAYRIGVMGGDGIGPEVVAEGLKVVAAAGVELEIVDYDLGGHRYLRDGTVLPDEVIEEWRALDARSRDDLEALGDDLGADAVASHDADAIGHV